VAGHRRSFTYCIRQSFFPAGVHTEIFFCLFFIMTPDLYSRETRKSKYVWVIRPAPVTFFSSTQGFGPFLPAKFPWHPYPWPNRKNNRITVFTCRTRNWIIAWGIQLIILTRTFETNPQTPQVFQNPDSSRLMADSRYERFWTSKTRLFWRYSFDRRKTTNCYCLIKNVKISISEVFFTIRYDR